MTRLSFGVGDRGYSDFTQLVHNDELLRDDSDNSTLCELRPESQAHIGSSQRNFNFARESKMLLKIAIPAVAVQLSAFFIFPQTASSVGRTLGTDALAGFSLASLTGNLTILSVMVGALTAADTLMPRAYGEGQYSEVGHLAIRGFVVCFFLLIPPLIPLCFYMDWVYDMLGQNKLASQLASEWIRVYLLGVPAMLLFRVLQSFLNAQHSVMPMAWAAMISSFIIHPIVLHIMVKHFGFLGSGFAVSITQTCMGLILVLILKFKPSYYLPETWPVVSIASVNDALAMRPIQMFLALSLGGVLSLSEWWFWETVCFMVGTFGIVPLCVHTIAYNIVPLSFMIPLGIAIGLTVRMGNILAKDVQRAKQMAMWCMAFTVALASIISGLMLFLRIAIVQLFSSDPQVLQGCEEIWPKLCYFIWILYIFGIQSAILRALGMQWELAKIIFICLWCGALPVIWYYSVRENGGIDAVWSILPVMYTLMQVLLFLSYANADWHKISITIRENSRLSMKQKELVTETTSLLVS